MNGKCDSCGGPTDTGGNCSSIGCLYKAFKPLPNFQPHASPGIEPRKGMKFETANPSAERIVSLIEFNGELILATERHIYRKEGDKWIPMRFIQADDDQHDEADYWKLDT